MDALQSKKVQLEGLSTTLKVDSVRSIGVAGASPSNGEVSDIGVNNAGKGSSVPVKPL